MNRRILLLLAILGVCDSATALDAGCEAILEASAARMAQSAWHSVTELAGGTRMETIKAGGKFYRREGSAWVEFPVDLDAAERDMIGQVRSGAIKLTQCQDAGRDEVDGKAVKLVTSRTEMAGLPAAYSTLYIGEDDGLPYRQTGDNLKVTYRYEGVTAPR